MGLLLIAGCEKGLQPPPGFEGTVTLPINADGKVEWPDSLNGAVVTFAEFSSDLSLSNLASALVDFSQPLDTTRSSQSYFLQANYQQGYIAGVVATRIPISKILVLPRDSIALHPEYFQIIGFYHDETLDPNFLFPYSVFSLGNQRVKHGINITIPSDYNPL